MSKIKIIQTIRLDKEQCRGTELYHAFLIGLGKDGCLYALKNISSNMRPNQLVWEKLDVKSQEELWAEND